MDRMFILLALAILLSAAPAANGQNAPADFVAPHNTSRAQVSVGPVAWNSTLAAYAQNYADKLSSSGCTLAHSGGPYGENLFWGSSQVFNAADAVAAWVSEKPYYNYATNSCAAGHQCGHYTQVVWRNSIGLGCGRAQCGSGAVIIVCSYSPPGNVVGQWPY